MNSDTFIEVPEDCPAVQAEVPPARNGRVTKAAIEYELIAREPSGRGRCGVSDARRDARHPEADWPAERERFLSQKKPRLRVSALAKRYGWGIHIDSDGRVALVPVKSAAAEYQRLAADPALRHVRAFRSKRA